MGYIVEVKCNNCGLTKTFHLGNGKKDFNHDVVAKNFLNRDILNNIYSNKCDWTFNWKLAVCNECGEIYRVPALLTFDEENGQKEFIEANCKCGCKDVSIIDVDENKMPICRECGEICIIQKNGLWD